MYLQVSNEQYQSGGPCWTTKTNSKSCDHLQSSIQPLSWALLHPSTALSGHVCSCYYIDQIIWTAEILDEIKKAGFETPTPIQVNLYVCAPIMCPDMFHFCGQLWFCLYLYVHVCNIHVYCWCMLLVVKSYPNGDLPGLPSSTLVQVRYGGWIVIGMVPMSC